MRAYVLRRALQAIPLLVGIAVLTFVLLQLAPGDFLASVEMNPQVSERVLERMRSDFGLDRPPAMQLLLYLRNVLLRLDFGQSFTYHQPVFAVLLPRLGNTLLLAGAAALVTWGLAIPLGVIAAVWPRTWADRGLSLAAYAALSVPEVVSGLLLLYLAARTRWFPIGGMHSLDAMEMGPWARAVDLARHLVLPALVVGAVPLAGRMRQMRSQMLEALRQDYVTAARARGLGEGAVVLRHALRNALNPMITLFGLTLGSLVSGSFVAEVIFSWPGLGSIALEAILRQDQYLVLGAVLMASVVLVAGNLVADVLLAFSDPRIVHGG